MENLKCIRLILGEIFACCLYILFATSLFDETISLDTSFLCLIAALLTTIINKMEFKVF